MSIPTSVFAGYSKCHFIVSKNASSQASNWSVSFNNIYENKDYWNRKLLTVSYQYSNLTGVLIMGRDGSDPRIHKIYLTN